MERLITVSVAATSFDLTNLDTVKDELEITDGESDVALSRYITEASSEMSAWFNRVFPKETMIETFRPGELASILSLSRRPIVSIASIVEDGTPLTSTDYEYDVEAGLLYRLRDDCRTAWCWKKTVVTYDGGWVLPGKLPPELAGACIATVKAKYSSKTRDPRLRVEEIRNVLHQEYWVGTIGDGSFPPGVNVEALAKYRNIPV